MADTVTVRSSKNPSVAELRAFIKDEVQKKGIVAFVVYSDVQAEKFTEAFNELEKETKWRHTLVFAEGIVILIIYTRELYSDQALFRYGRNMVVAAALRYHRLMMAEMN